MQKSSHPLRLIGLALFLVACQQLALPFGGVKPASGSVLFQDDFSDPASGWRQPTENAGGVLDYAYDTFHIQVNDPQTLMWSGPGLRFTDVRIEVDAIKAAGPEDDDFGVVCRAQDRENFYFLVISGDGYYGIGKVEEGVQTLIGMPALLPSEEVHRGVVLNHMRADCIDNTLSFYVNGLLLKTVEDDTFSGGDVGLAAGTFNEAGTEVYFDNFTVLQP